MATEVQAKLNLPRLQRVVLRDFSLFTRNPEIDVYFQDGVTCIAGANGLGKSTFVAAVNFGLTGRVPDPMRTFESVDEYYRFTRSFSEDFFDGRIKEAVRGSAEVELELIAGETTFRLIRNMFEPDALRFLEIRSGGAALEPPNLDEASPAEKHKLFTENLTQQIGLDSFEQFVFIQLFLLTFDE